jgi:UDP-N-acetylglucosamine 2-epimerase (non-hydrolysing)
MKIGIIIGTRPEVIKMSPVILECEERGINYFVIHSNQHYSPELDGVFFHELKLKTPKYNLNVGSGLHGAQTGKMLEGIEQCLKEEVPDVVIVHGDTNTALAGALAAVKLHISVAHVEAGLRSYDRRMPEEVNRVIIDHISNYLFVPTENSALILSNEGISKGVHVVGNTIVDAVLRNVEISKEKSDVLNELKLTKGKYAVLTIHRPENTDDPEKLQDILKTMGEIAKTHHVDIVFPAHPRTNNSISSNKMIISPEVRIVQPFGYFDFLSLQSNAKFILTDSGGIQEEACILHVPCVTLRETTERPETVEVGANAVVGVKFENINNALRNYDLTNTNWAVPFGNGDSSRKILDILLNYCCEK